jgi:hypothetical protein
MGILRIFITAFREFARKSRFLYHNHTGKHEKKQYWTADDWQAKLCFL